jgi:hypothetical protein
MSKLTAVEWLAEKYILVGMLTTPMVERAKAMEREQIIETWHNGYNNQSPMIDEENCGQQYYAETYKGGEQ